MLEAELVAPQRRAGKAAGRAAVSVTVIKAVALALSTYMDGPRAADPGGNARPGRDRLAGQLGVGPTAIDQALSALVGAGWLERTARGHTGQTATYAAALPTKSVGQDEPNSDRRDEHTEPRATVREPKSVRHSDRRDGRHLENRDDRGGTYVPPTHLARPECDNCGGGGMILGEDLIARPCSTCNKNSGHAA